MSPLHSGILLLSYFSTGIIMPVLSLLLLSRGCTMQTLPLMLGLYSLTALFLEVPSGVFADWRGRKPTCLLSVALVMAAFMLLLSAGSLPLVAAAMVLWGGKPRLFLWQSGRAYHRRLFGGKGGGALGPDNCPAHCTPERRDRVGRPGRRSFAGCERLCAPPAPAAGTADLRRPAVHPFSPRASPGGHTLPSVRPALRERRAPSGQPPFLGPGPLHGRFGRKPRCGRCVLAARLPVHAPFQERRMAGIAVCGKLFAAHCGRARLRTDLFLLGAPPLERLLFPSVSVGTGPPPSLASVLPSAFCGRLSSLLHCAQRQQHSGTDPSQRPQRQFKSGDGPEPCLSGLPTGELGPPCRQRCAGPPPGGQRPLGTLRPPSPACLRGLRTALPQRQAVVLL